MKLFTIGKRLPVTVALALLFISAGWAQATDAYVLSAGVDNYLYNNKLTGCVADARNTTAAFTAQQGKLFKKVYSQTLLDEQATHAKLMQHMQALARKGAAGDYVVIFLSGHGGRTADKQGISSPTTTSRNVRRRPP